MRHDSCLSACRLMSRIVQDRVSGQEATQLEATTLQPTAIVDGSPSSGSPVERDTAGDNVPGA